MRAHYGDLSPRFKIFNETKVSAAAPKRPTVLLLFPSLQCCFTITLRQHAFKAFERSSTQLHQLASVGRTIGFAQ
jgi:hypothetical protein